MASLPLLLYLYIAAKREMNCCSFFGSWKSVRSIFDVSMAACELIHWEVVSVEMPRADKP